MSKNCLLGIVFICTSFLLSNQIESAERPNILMILVDDLGYGDLSCYGATDLKSPHVDALAERGMSFSNFYANCCVCSPTRAALLTGRYPALVGVPGVIRTYKQSNWGFFDPSAKSLGKLLTENGYHTALVGKWHLGLKSPNHPNERGFQHFKGFLGDMMDDYYKHRRHGINYMRLNDKEIDPEGHATDLFGEWACDYITERKGKEEPFFLYLAYNAPHTPIQPPKEWVEKVMKREEGISTKRAKLVALIEHMDDSIGKVIQTLKETGQDKDTIVVFSSDNGGQISVGANNGPTRDGKGSMYEGGLKVPTVVVWPDKVEAGSKSELNLLTMDIYPTLAAVAGVEELPTIDGVSFLPTVLGEEQPTIKRDLYFRRRETYYMGKTTDAMIRGDWKLVQNSPFGPLELFNLKIDPLEKKDLFNTKEGNQVKKSLVSAMGAHIQAAGNVPWQRPKSLQETTEKK